MPSILATVEPRLLNSLDYVVIAIYFALNLGIGWWCARKHQSADDYLRGGGKTSWWAAGISFFATGASSISFMAIPAKTYATDWLSFGSVPAQGGATLIVAFVFVALLRRLNITTVFEYLEMRFNRAVRLLCAVLTLLLKIFGRMSIVMLLPSLALSTVTGLNVYVSILLIGGVTIVYSIVGGYDAVIWTDVMQVCVTFGGVAIALAFVFLAVPHGMDGVFQIAHENQKLHAISWDWDLTQPTVIVFLGMAWGSVFTQLSDQPLMQRVFSTSDVKAAKRSVALGAFFGISTAFVFFFIGTALFAFYRIHPERLTDIPTDAIFPYFIANELPHGVVGAIIAGLFASAMGALSSNTNSTATIVVTDGYSLLRPKATEKAKVRVARFATFFSGAAATGMAIYLAGRGVSSLWDQFLRLIALIGGGFPGVFALGLLTRRANSGGVIIGALASIGVTWWVQEFTQTNVFFHTFVAVASCMIVGYIASFAFTKEDARRDLSGLTLWAKKRPVPVGVPKPVET